MLEDKATKNLGTSSLSSSHKNRSVLVPVSEHSFCTCCIVCLFHFQKKKNLFHYFKIGETFVFKLLKNVIAALQACCTVDLLNILYMSWSIVVHFRNLCYWRPHPTHHHQNHHTHFRTARLRSNCCLSSTEPDLGSGDGPFGTASPSFYRDKRAGAHPYRLSSPLSSNTKVRGK